MNTNKTFRHVLLTTNLVAMSACGGGGNSATPPPPPTPTPTTYLVGGTVSGLLGSNLELQNNGSNDLAISSDGNFMFAGSAQDGSAYSVTVLTQPAGPSQTCTIANGAGSISGSNITTVSIGCDTDTFVVGGAVSGLKGSGLRLQNNAQGGLPINIDGDFQFLLEVASGESYNVTVLDDPTNPDQSCTVSAATGIVSDTPVSDVVISCTSLAVTSIDAGANVSCAILENDKTKCWGDNLSGNLGQGDTLGRGRSQDQMGNDLDFIAISRLHTAQQIVTGSHSCALLDDGDIKCWGRNAEGQLGQGDTDNRGDDPDEMEVFLPRVNLGTDRTAVQIAANNLHSCALLDNGRIKCWGSNWSGQLGLGDTDNRGDDLGEMGDNLAEVDVGSTARRAVQIAVGGDHSCAILDNQKTKCWGHNIFGQLGLGDVVDRGDNPNEMGTQLPSVDLGSSVTAIQIVAGLRHTCALLDSGRVKCWGDNSSGQLGLGDTDNRGDDANEMGLNLSSVSIDSVNFKAIQIAVGRSHTCALLDNNQMKCWGLNDFGQLGQSDVANRGDEPGELGFNLPFVEVGAGLSVVSITAGRSHTCALLDSDKMKCWGRGFDGQLGQETQDNVGDDPGEMGDNLSPIDIGGQ